METKFLEIRDAATFIPALAVRLSGADHYLARRAGFGPYSDYILLIKLEDSQCHYDIYGWGGGARTMSQAHNHIVEHWDELSEGDVVDVEFILGERPDKKLSEKLTNKGEE